MKFFSVMKLVVVASALCSLNAMAAGIFGEASSGGDGRTHVNYYKGKGAMVFEDARDEVIDYEVTLKTVALDDGRQLLEYNFVAGSTNTYHRTIIENTGNGVRKVYVPAGKDAQHDYASYVETGWGHKIEYEDLRREEGTAKKRTILLNYLDMDGKRVTHHILAYKKDGKRVYYMTASVGNADGVIHVSYHKLEHVISRRPE